MVNVIPDIHVTREIKKVKNNNPLIRDVVCLIGCFEDDTTTNTPVLCETLTDAETVFGDDTSVDANAALKQIEDIKFIKNMKKFNELPENVQEVANLRLEYPEISLVELGKMLRNPVGKSGVNYRLKVISNFAEELRK